MSALSCTGGNLVSETNEVFDFFDCRCSAHTLLSFTSFYSEKLISHLFSSLSRRLPDCGRNVLYEDPAPKCELL